MVAAVEPAIQKLATQLWATHPNNPENKENDVVAEDVQGPPRRLSADEIAQGRAEVEQAEGDIEEPMDEQAIEAMEAEDEKQAPPKVVRTPRAAERVVKAAEEGKAIAAPRKDSKLRLVYDRLEQACGLTGAEIRELTGLSCVTQIAAAAARAHMAELVITKEGRSARYSIRT
ncbi:MAG: hypothetical protein K0S72_1625 [Arthrobacter sp.]|nr:hypothetical protein [Arthrobacter sp.]